MSRGVFVVIEGTDGSGSSTQCELLRRDLRRTGRSVLLTKEPTRGPAGAIVQLALDRRLHGPNRHFYSSSGEREPAASELDFHTMALLYAADRMDHVEGVIKPALDQGWVVISDRYVLSTMAYQGLHLDVDWLLEINRYALLPDLTLFLDVPPSHTQLRMKAERLTVEANDAKPKQERIRDSYRWFIRTFGSRLGRIETIDASATVSSVRAQIKALVDPLFSSDPQIVREPSLFPEGLV